MSQGGSFGSVFRRGKDRLVAMFEAAGFAPLLGLAHVEQVVGQQSIERVGPQREPDPEKDRHKWAQVEPFVVAYERLRNRLTLAPAADAGDADAAAPAAAAESDA